LSLAHFSDQDVFARFLAKRRVGVEFGHGDTHIEHLNAVTFKPKLFIKNIGIEVRCGRCFAG
jgi:hypothetical protein